MVQLDALRAFAVLGVLAQHFVPVTEKILPLGSMGVRLFFVLSGFLITGILLKCREDSELPGQSKGFSLRRFYARRFLRIFPVYYLVLIVTAIINIRPSREAFFWNVTYLTNVYLSIRGGTHGPISHFWSLAVEEQFYLVWPWLILFIPFRWLPTTVVLTILVGPLFRLAGVIEGGNLFPFVHLPFGCLDSLGAGALLAILSDRSTGNASARRVFSNVGLFAGLPLCILLQVLHWLDVPGHFPWMFVLQDFFMALAFAWLVAGAARGFGGVAGSLLKLKPLLYIGTISYGIYVYHMFMLIVVPRACQYIGVSLANPVLYAVILTTVSIAIAASSWHFFEKPINDLKRYFPYRREKGASSRQGDLAVGASSGAGVSG